MKGKPPPNTADGLALINSQMSRYLRTLGRYNVKRKCDGFGWVEETRDKRYPNRKAIFLTPAGREILAQISDVLEHGKTADTPLSR